MKKRLHIRALTAIAALSLQMAASAANAEGYACRFENRMDGNWVSPLIVFEITGQRKAFVHDSVTLAFNEGPVEARVRTNNNRRINLAWEVRGESRSGQRIDMHYTLNYNKNTGRVYAVAKPNGYDNTFREDGVCSVRPAG